MVEKILDHGAQPHRGFARIGERLAELALRRRDLLAGPVEPGVGDRQRVLEIVDDELGQLAVIALRLLQRAVALLQLVARRLELDQRLLVRGQAVGQLAARVVKLQEHPDLAAQDHRAERLVEDVDGARPVALEQVVLGLVHRGEEDDRDLSRLRILARVVRHLVAVHVRHLHVEQHHRELTLEELAQALVSRLGAHQIAVDIAEERLQRHQVRLHVVHQQNARPGHESPSSIVRVPSSSCQTSCAPRLDAVSDGSGRRSVRAHRAPRGGRCS